MLQEGDKVKIYNDKIDYYKKHAYSFMDLDNEGIVYQVMEQTAVVMYGHTGFNVDKNDLYVVERRNSKWDIFV